MNTPTLPKRPDPIDHLTGRRHNRAYPPGVSLPGAGGKFATDGSVQFWPGNTFVCHVCPDSTAYETICALQEEVKMSRFARLFTFMPAASLHMTVFQGCDPTKTDQAVLPKGAKPGLQRDALSACILKTVEDVCFDPAPRARMVDLYCCHSMTVTGAAPEGEAPLRAMRETLRDATGITPPNFDSYVFHITLGYLIDWLTEATARAAVDFSAELSERYTPLLQDIPLEAVAFCNFDTMHHFEPLKTLT